jgi:predicted unusual protein kinase regulating ubiquinone biosynthesis (AarF/ABC1/UbiB family)
MGGDVGDAFGSFDATPMASALVAQAHRATLKDGTPGVSLPHRRDNTAETAAGDGETHRRS